MTAQSLLIIGETEKGWLTHYNIDEPTYLTLANSVFPGAKFESIMLAVQYCTARGLDVLKKPVHIVPMYVKDAQTGKDVWRDVIMPGIYEYRMTANRTGEYVGIDKPEFGPMVEILFNETTHTVPEDCTVTVYRLIGGERVAFSHTEWFEEAAATTKKGDLNSMWTKRKRGQLSKCAEAGALRKAFPDELGGVITADEINTEQVIEGTATVVEPVSQLLPETSEFYSDENFDKNFPTWEKSIVSGKNTPESVIKKISSKNKLSEDQIKKIKAVKPAGENK